MISPTDVTRVAVAIGYLIVSGMVLWEYRFIRPVKRPLYLVGFLAAVGWAVFYSVLLVYDPRPTTLWLLPFHLLHATVILHVVLVVRLRRYYDPGHPRYWEGVDGADHPWGVDAAVGPGGGVGDGPDGASEGSGG